MSLVSKMGKNVSAHFCWTDLLVVLDQAGPTQLMLNNLSKVIGQYPGLGSLAQHMFVVGTSGDRLRQSKHLLST